MNRRRHAGNAALLVLVLLLFIDPRVLSARARQKEIIPFEPGDTIEEIRYKIDHNGYEFTVEENWVFNMSPGEKERFFSRHAPLHPRKHDASDDIGPLAGCLGKMQLPSNFDWRNYGGRSYIGPIRDQGACGSCYAFGACAAAEGTYNWFMQLFNEDCADFSEAFIAFCLSDRYSGFDGCNGASYDYEELDALVDYGVCNESVYPYLYYEWDCLSSSWIEDRVRFSSWHRIPCGDIDAIKTAIMTYGVVDAAVFVTTTFEAYSSGIYEEEDHSVCDGTPCYYTAANHAIALVGWNDNGDPENNGYWILRNSWGESWGESGYMRIKYRYAGAECAACYLDWAPLPTPTPAARRYLSVFKGSAPNTDLLLYREPEIGDMTYWDAVARNPSPAMTDTHAIPGGDVVASAGVDLDGDGEDEMAVLKRDFGSDMNLYIYEGLRPPSQHNKFPIAYDLWVIPAGNNILLMANAGDVNGDGREDLAVLRKEYGNDYNLYIYQSPYRGDFTYEAALNKNEAPLARDLWLISRGNDVVAMAGADRDGDFKNDGLAVLRNQSGDYNLYVWKTPVYDDLTYTQSLARQNGFDGPGTPQAMDLWVIPTGNNLATMSPVQYLDAPEGKIAVVNGITGDQNLYVYNLPRYPDKSHFDALARNPSPLARDLWIIPSGNDTVDMLGTN